MEIGFKIIAIQPLGGCTDYIRKNLTIGKKYYFYSGYSINDDDSFQIDESETLTSTFYNESGIPISISAVVGQNGSGKSNLIELLMRVINNLSYCMFSDGKVSEKKYNLKPAFDVEAKIYYLIDEVLYSVYVNSASRPDEKDLLLNREPYHGKQGALYKKITHTISKTTKSGVKITITEIEEQREILFYTLIVNYSMYAYNVNDYQKEWVGITEKYNGRLDGYLCWLDGLFHKNDGYRTPIVLNPFRDEGVIDVNNERFLTYSRFVSLMIDEDTSKRFYRVNRDKIVDKIEISAGSIRDRLGRKIHSNIYKIIKDELSDEDKKGLSQINEPSVEGIFSGDPSVLNCDIYKKFEENSSTAPLVKRFNEYGKYILECWAAELSQKETDVYPLRKDDPTLPFNDYIIIKTIKTSTTYKDILDTVLTWKIIFSGKDETEIKSIIKDTVSKLYKDRSHITLKLRQSLIFKYWGHRFYDKSIIEYSIDDFNIVIQKTKREVVSSNDFLQCDILNFLPPPIFDINISLKEEQKESFPFDNLSSGEKQFIFSTSTILYHLKNIESAHLSKDGRATYRYVNLILDEIELCFHPEMQRRQIKELIDAINNIKLANIKSINICLLTHSPIILSDIPHQNVLFMNSNSNTKEMRDSSFGANIHSLYKHSFFMDLPMGEFAKNKIEALFDKLRNKTNLSGKQLSDIKTEIQLIGEPLLRNQLMKLYYEKCNIEERVLSLEKELEDLKKSIK